MKKRDYFLKALADEAFRYKRWGIEAFSLVKKTNTEPEFDYQLLPGESCYYFIDPHSGEAELLDDTSVDKPPFSFIERVALEPGEPLNNKETRESTYGSLLVNTVVLVYPFGDKIDYVDGEFDIKKVEGEIVSRLTTDPERQQPGEFVAENPIYVSEYLNFIDAALSLEGYSQLCVPSATPKSLTRDPRIPERRAELLEKYKDQLDDPAIIAKIDAELIAMDREWIKGDLSEGFYHKSKSFDVVRKKMHLMHGYEAGFDQDPDLIPRSLSEGWDVEKLPSMANSLREGSHARGSMTALGGYATKIVNRMLQNSTIVEEDCGSTLGVEREITEENAEEFVGFYYLSGGKAKLVEQSNYASLIGRKVRFRSPMFCKSPKTGFCKTCMGQPNSESDKALSALAAEITSQLMNASMQKAHGKALKTAKYIPSKAIS